MKYRIGILLLIFVSGFSVAQSKYDTYSGFTVPTTAILPATEVHPALFFNASQAAKIKSKKTADTYAATLWSRVNSLISSYKSKDPAGTDINTRPQMAKILALHWILYGDTTSRRLAIACLSTAYDNVPRTSTSSDFDGDYDEIYRATWLQNYCEAYDWVYSELTTAQNTDIRNRIATETLLLVNNMVSGAKYAPRPHNHRSKPAWGIVTAALTLSSDSRAAAWLTFGLTQANTVTKYQFSADGIYREGSHYMLYSYVNYLPYLWHYKNVSGVDHFQFYRASFEMPILLRNGRGWLPNIEDGYEKPFPGHMAAAAYMQTPTLLHPTEPLGKILQWNWANTSFITNAYTGATNDAVWDIDDYLTYDPTITAAAPVFNGTFNTQAGVALFRDSSSLAQVPSKYLLFHAVPECDNHNHPDLLSYILSYKNTILATDAGYGKDGSSDADRAWYTSAAAHNIVTTNGSGPMDIADNVGPTSSKFINSPVCDISEKIAGTSAANGKIKRGIIFPERNYWVVYDVMTASAAASYILNIHSRGSLSLSANKATWTESFDTYGKGARLHSFILASAPDTLSTATGTTSLYKDADPQTYVQAKMTGSNAAFLHLLFPADSTVAFPDIKDISSGVATGFVMSDPGSETHQTTLLRQKNTTSLVNKITTDAICLWTRHDSLQLKKYALIDGRVLSFNSTNWLTASQNVTLTADLSSAGKTTLIIDTITTSTKLSVRPSFKVDSSLNVYFNGNTIAFSIDSGRVNITLTGTGTLEIIPQPNKTDKSTLPVRGSNLIKIKGVYPNPANPSTRIVVSIEKPTYVALDVYDILGKKTASLLPWSQQQGEIAFLWNGKDDEGRQVVSGCYFARLTSSEISVSKKFLTLK